MNIDDIIRTAKEAGFDDFSIGVRLELLERFAALVASAERNRILAICKEGLWDAEGIRYHLENQDRGKA